LALGVLFLGLFFAILGAGFWIWPELSREFLNGMHKVAGENGENNPCLWAMVGDLAALGQQITGRSLPTIIPAGIYGILVIALLAIAADLFARLKSFEPKRGDLWRICLVCLVYGVIAPRFKNYSFILLIPPAIFILSSCRWLNPSIPLGLLLVLSSHRSFLALGTAFEPVYRIQGEYYCWLLALLLLVLACFSILRESASAATSVPTAPSGRGSC
jgi:hypothetical protein